MTHTLCIYERMFVDDMGILIPTISTSFQEVKSCIALYKMASRAKLNIHKSIMIPIGFSQIPSWLQEKGCKLLEQGEITRYLGASLGYLVPQVKLLDYYINKLSKRIASWKEKNISFAGKIILIRQVLAAIPIYHRMASYFMTTASNQIQHLCKDFLWGFNEAGQRKIPLISQEIIARPRIQGGLAIRNILAQGTMLLDR